MPEAGIHLELMAPGKKMGAMLERGEISGLMVPHPPHQALAGSEKIRRLFAYPKQAEINYLRKNGYYPIMHVVAFKDDVLNRDPALAVNVMRAFDNAKEACEAYYEDPNWSRFVWVRHFFEEERKAFGDDPWHHGLKKSGQSRTIHKLFTRPRTLDRKLEVDELFARNTLNS